MARPASGYHLKDGTKVPGVTTIIIKDYGGLMQWAFKQGQSGAAHLYDEAEKAADIGTAAHSMVEQYIKGSDSATCYLIAKTTLPDPEMAEKAISAFNAYKNWASNFQVNIVAQEIQLVSEQYRYGGTPDAIGMVGNQLILIDYKTSNAVYADYLFQLAAYKNLWEENFPDRPLTGGFHLCRFAKENADFAHHYYPQLDNEWRGFVLMRELYDIRAAAKKRV